MPTPRSFAALATFALLMVAACDGSLSEPELAEPPVSLNIISGANQTALAYTQLSEPIQAQLLTGKGRPVKGQVVNFRVVQGGGSVWAGSSVTDKDGMVKEWWTLGSGGLRDLLEARTIDPETGEQLVVATAQATALPLIDPRVRCRIPPATSWIPAAPGDCGVPVDQGAPAVPFNTSVDVELQVTHNGGVPVPGLQLDFGKDGGGSLTPVYAVTDAAGMARLTLTMGSTIPNNALQVYFPFGFGANFDFRGVN